MVKGSSVESQEVVCVVSRAPFSLGGEPVWANVAQEDGPETLLDVFIHDLARIFQGGFARRHQGTHVMMPNVLPCARDVRDRNSVAVIAGALPVRVMHNRWSVEHMTIFRR